MNTPPTIVVLAAGQGSRFGGTQHKLTQAFGPGSVLSGTLRHALETQFPVVVVTTEALAPEAARLVATRDTVVLSDAQAQRGMGHSIAAGVSARADASGWLVLPGDMPLIRPSTLRQIGSALAGHPVVYAQYQGLRGHPVGFSAELYSELIALTGDEGARRLLARYPALGVEVDDPGVRMDVDTEADLVALRAAAGIA